MLTLINQNMWLCKWLRDNTWLLVQNWEVKKQRYEKWKSKDKNQRWVDAWMWSSKLPSLDTCFLIPEREMKLPTDKKKKTHNLNIDNHFLFCWLKSRNYRASPLAQTVKNSPVVQMTGVQSLGQEGLLEEEVAFRSNILAWRIPRTEEPGGLQSMRSQ